MEPKPSRQLKRALKEAEHITKHPERYKSYDNIDDLFRNLDSDD